MTYRLQGGVDSPVNQWLEVVRVGTGEVGRIARHNAQIGVIGLVEPSSLDNGYAQIGCSESGCQSKSSSPAADNDIVKGRIPAG